MKIKPLYDRCVVRVLAEGEKTKGGLIVPEVARHTSIVARGEVLAIGPGRPTALDARILAPMHVKEGDVVVFPRKAGNATPWADEPDGSVVILDERDIMGVAYDLERDTGLVAGDGTLLKVLATPGGTPVTQASLDRLIRDIPTVPGTK